MWGSDRSGEFLDEFRVAAGGLVSLLETVLELEGKRFSVTRLAKRWSPYAPWTPPRNKGEAWWLLVQSINAGLHSTPLTLSWVREGKRRHRSQELIPALGHWGPPFILHQASSDCLYGVCILELVDHLLATDRPYRICANEACGQLFSVQEGRSR